MTSGDTTDILIISATHLAVREIGPWLRGVLEGIPGGPALGGRIELALHELCVNVVDHAYTEAGEGDIHLRAEVDRDRVCFEVSDRGRPLDMSASSRPQPGVPQIRGYGLMIIDQLVDEVSYRRAGDTNHWTLQIRRPEKLQH